MSPTFAVTLLGVKVSTLVVPLTVITWTVTSDEAAKAAEATLRAARAYVENCILKEREDLMKERFES